MAIRTPSWRIVVSRLAVSSMLRMSVVSVISSVSALGIQSALGERLAHVADQPVGVELTCRTR